MRLLARAGLVAVAVVVLAATVLLVYFGMWGSGQ